MYHPQWSSFTRSCPSHRQRWRLDPRQTSFHEPTTHGNAIARLDRRTLLFDRHEHPRRPSTSLPRATLRCQHRRVAACGHLDEPRRGACLLRALAAKRFGGAPDRLRTLRDWHLKQSHTRRRPSAGALGPFIVGKRFFAMARQGLAAPLGIVHFRFSRSTRQSAFSLPYMAAVHGSDSWFDGAICVGFADNSQNPTFASAAMSICLCE